MGRSTWGGAEIDGILIAVDTDLKLSCRVSQGATKRTEALGANFGRARSFLHSFPLLARDTSLAKNEGEQRFADVSAMRVGNRQDELTTNHELVPAAENGPWNPSVRRPATRSRRLTAPHAGISSLGGP